MVLVPTARILYVASSWTASASTHRRDRRPPFRPRQLPRRSGVICWPTAWLSTTATA